MALVKSLGGKPTVAAGGLECLDYLPAHGAPDLIFMDCQMPEMDGYETTRAIRRRQDSSAKGVIIALTANAFEEDRHRCKQAGMDDFLAKPVTLETMGAMVSTWKGRATERRQNA